MDIIKSRAFCINNSICARFQPGDREEERGYVANGEYKDRETCRLSVSTLRSSGHHPTRHRTCLKTTVKSAHYADYKIDYNGTI